jgi:hypothetical protein
VKLDWIYAEIAYPSCNDFQWTGSEDVHVLFRYPPFDLRTEVFNREILVKEEIFSAKIGKVSVIIGSSKYPVGIFYFITLFSND